MRSIFVPSPVINCSVTRWDSCRWAVITRAPEAAVAQWSFGAWRAISAVVSGNPWVACKPLCTHHRLAILAWLSFRAFPPLRTSFPWGSRDWHCPQHNPVLAWSPLLRIVLPWIPLWPFWTLWPRESRKAHVPWWPFVPWRAFPPLGASGPYRPRQTGQAHTDARFWFGALWSWFSIFAWLPILAILPIRTISALGAGWTWWSLMASAAYEQWGID